MSTAENSGELSRPARDERARIIAIIEQHMAGQPPLVQALLRRIINDINREAT